MKRKLHVLLADDDVDDRFFFDKALECISIPTELIAVENGENLMTYLLKAEKLPDVLFLDINMPRKNGVECLSEIKAHPHLKRLPVIMYSTSLNETVADMIYEKGASYYIQKTDFTDLPALLERALDLVSEKIHSQPSRSKFVLKAGKLA
jgi:CheY-like chemotaxis protein